LPSFNAFSLDCGFITELSAVCKEFLVFECLFFDFYSFNLPRFSLIANMEILESSSALKVRIEALKKAGKVIGFVPTMGALHKGHLSLAMEAGKQTDVVVVSVFVNPTQFNNLADLERYPRDIQKDADMLSETPCELLFVPTVKEVYPEPDTRLFDFGAIDKVMEGHFRPGHFNGVAQVVSRLFDLVKPDKAFFGEKDFQQLAIVRDMVRQLNYPVEIVSCPIIREEDGLAMSSRNQLLSDAQRKNAPVIARTLSESCNFAKSHHVSDTIQFVIECINASPELQVEYFEIVEGSTLQTVNSWNESDYIVGCIAVFAGEIRLIDNVIYRKGIS
jgi:pantoate--beta-alanine ligase